MRTRNVEIIIYNEDDLQSKVDICEEFNLYYAYILHDKDFDDKTGELIKPHYHLRVFDTNQRTISAWSKIFNVEEHDIETLKDKKRAIRYLIHLDSPNKYQYSMYDVTSNIYDIEDYFKEDKTDEIKQLNNIFNYLDEIQGYIYFKEVKSYVLEHQYWSAYRRYYSIIKDVIVEHNRYAIDYMLN